ncbi:glycosyltransferase family 25 protein [Psychrobacter pulmonis]|uniref:glycosyltransferase family 25 protein n=1 Tax=Psychrobacter pulmonis TaxID=228654 RepID=UPI00191B380B|nr:glycosyltransferase family 25 protein [Psychrobacter pulmonis]
MKIDVYLINLDSSVERLKQADIELKKHNIAYQRIPAVDGRRLNVHNYKNYDGKQAHQLMGRDLLGAEIGCYLSHLRCIERFLASDADYLIVLEDDLILEDDLQTISQKVLVWLEEQNLNWYMMNLAANKRKISKHLHQVGKFNLLKAYYFPVLTLGLIWSRQGAEGFYQDYQIISAPIDVTLQSWLTKNSKGLSVYPELVIANNVQSDIDPTQNSTMKIKYVDNPRIGKRFPRQKRMWSNKYIAIKNKLLNK